MKSTIWLICLFIFGIAKHWSILYLVPEFEFTTSLIVNLLPKSLNEGIWVDLPNLFVKTPKRNQHQNNFLSRDCGSVGRAVASNTRDLQFLSNRHEILFTINYIESCIWKDENKE